MELLSTLIGLQLLAISPVFGELLWGRKIPFLTQSQSLITSTTKVQSSEILTSRLPPVAVSVPEIARQVTVRILTEPGLGSGVIIDRQGQTYTVLTCYHVVENSYYNQYTVLTSDGKSYPAQWLQSVQFPNLDLALVQFTSNQSYQVATIDLQPLTTGELVYAAGFPNWYWPNPNSPLSTKDWGNKAYHLTVGKVGMLLARSLPKGYQLGYTNEVENGMSGGPVLNQYGRLIGINGRLKYPFQGIDVFKFEDGTLPSEDLFQQMEALSWAIPISRFQKPQTPPVSETLF
ncbi:S1 family peptidase [Planktothrix pseudagardhii]|uniref:Peptidase S1 n=1 Tax=Planktothrix pseudagardhii TaxID=132604 RepID=A0A9W4GAT0_9CYAN|nr:serine protease [Planktothrix pseudagardhii]CAD5978880.1 Peptidase S1 [Planktothrix pseudagardhii]